MRKLINSTKHVNAGNGQAAATARRNAFVQAYIANGNNATQAAITAGYSPKTAYSQGQRLLKKVEISRELAEAAQSVAEITGLKTQRVLLETARLAYSDPARIYREDGSVKHVTEMDEDTRAAIAAIEINENVVDGVVVGRTTKIKFWDKVRALEMGMKHLGLYERDNIQQREKIQIEVVLVEGPSRPADKSS
jgi:phage terminase small subunit